MNRAFRLRPLLATALLVFLSGCATVPTPVISRDGDPLASAAPAVSGSVEAGAEIPTEPAGPDPFAAQITPGTGRVIDQQVAGAPAPSLDLPGEATFNF